MNVFKKVDERVRADPQKFLDILNKNLSEDEQERLKVESAKLSDRKKRLVFGNIRHFKRFLRSIDISGSSTSSIADDLKTGFSEYKKK